MQPYRIIEAGGMQIAFIGVTTPETLTTSTPRYFQNEDGEFIYSFLNDATGEGVWSAVQKAADDARAEGADYVYVMAHLGNNTKSAPWMYDGVISNTTGIDVFLDGHSHDTDQVVMKNKDGHSVVRSACGTKMQCIGYSRISPETGIVETGIWSWSGSVSLPEAYGIQNAIQSRIQEEEASLNELLSQEVARSDVTLTICDPAAVDSSGTPVRMVRRAETNLGDLCADALRIETGADVGLIGGGGIRKSLEQGGITGADIISVFPFGNGVCLIRATGQQILDALEWGVSRMPAESGGFLQVSGMSYEVDPSIASGCQKDENGMMIAIMGERRVRNVLVGDVPLDPDKTYTVAGIDYNLLNYGDGQTAFDGAEVLEAYVGEDYRLLIDYIADTLGGKIGAEYADPLGQGRITILDPNV